MVRSTLPPPPLARLKRVAFGELTNGSAQDPNFRSKTERDPGEPTHGLKEKNKQQLNDENEVDGSVGELKKCSFSSSIYEHLHSLEVKKNSSTNFYKY